MQIALNFKQPQTMMNHTNVISSSDKWKQTGKETGVSMLNRVVLFTVDKACDATSRGHDKKVDLQSI